MTYRPCYGRRADKTLRRAEQNDDNPQYAADDVSRGWPIQ